MIVVDASVLANALTDDGPVGAHGRAELARDAHWAAPEHLVGSGVPACCRPRPDIAHGEARSKRQAEGRP